MAVTPGSSDAAQDLLETAIVELYGSGTKTESLTPQQLQAAQERAKQDFLKSTTGRNNPKLWDKTLGPQVSARVADFSNPNNAQVKAFHDQEASTTARKQTVQQIQDIANGNVTTGNQTYYDQQVAPYIGSQVFAANEAKRGDEDALAQQTAARDKASARMNSAVSAQRQLATDYTGQQNALNAQDQGSLSRYLGETDPLMSQIQARSSDPNDVASQQRALQAAIGASNGSLDYTAAQARTNAQDLARQQGSYNTMNDIGMGGLNYDADQYYSSLEDQQRQQDAYQNYGMIGAGGLDYTSQAANARASDKSLADQQKALGDIQKDVASGDKDQREIYDLMKSRTGVQSTAEEALQAELARRKFENDDRSSREAVMENLAQRGLRSGSAEIAGQLASREQASQDRVLAELGMQANAINRAANYTTMSGQQANAMRGNAQNALGMQGNLSTAIRNADFDESYKRGVGADTASANNQQTKLSGYQLQGQQANAIRGANDAVGTFNTGQRNVAKANNQQTQLAGYQGAANMATQMRNASDAMSIANAGYTNQAYANNQSTRMQGIGVQANQSNAIRSANDLQRQFEDNMKASEAARVGNLATSRANTSLNTTNQVSARNDNTFAANSKPNDMEYSAAGDQYGMDTDVANATRGVGTNSFNRATTIAGSAMTGAGVRAGSNAQLLDALRLGLGEQDYEDSQRILGR